MDGVHFADVVNNAHRPCANFLPDRSAIHQDRALAFEFVAVLYGVARLALHCFWPGLQDVELAVDTVFAPLNVHGTAVMVFDHQCVVRKLLHIAVGQGIAVAQFRRHVRGFHQLGASGLFFWAGELHL